MAASLVFLVHFLTLFGGQLGDAAAGWAAWTAEAVARTGTDAFFVISGYLIYGMAVRRPLDFGRFLRDRLDRIYPTFLAVFCLYVGLSVVFRAESKIPADPAAAVAYLVENLAFVPGLVGGQAMIVPTWSLSYELMLYATVPPFVRLTGLRERSRPVRVGVVATLAVAYWLACVAFGGNLRPAVFAAGFLAYETVTWRQRPTARGTTAALVFAVLGLGSFLILRTHLVRVPDVAGLPCLAQGLRLAALAVGLYGLAVGCFGGRGRLSRALCWKPLVWLGNRSYSFFLIHGLALKALALVVAQVLPTSWQGPGLFWVRSRSVTPRLSPPRPCCTPSSNARSAGRIWTPSPCAGNHAENAPSAAGS